MYCEICTAYTSSTIMLCSRCQHNPYIAIDTHRIEGLYYLNAKDLEHVRKFYYTSHTSFLGLRSELHKIAYDKLSKLSPKSIRYCNFMNYHKVYQIAKNKADTQISKFRFVITTLRDLTAKYIDPPNILDREQFISYIYVLCANPMINAADILYHMINEYDRLVKEQVVAQ